MTDVKKAELCAFCGVPLNDETAVKTLENCYEASRNWYRENDVDVDNNPDAEFWVKNLTGWFYDNRGREGASIPGYIVVNLHMLRGC